jgi:hypothetical protein
LLAVVLDELAELLEKLEQVTLELGDLLPLLLLELVLRVDQGVAIVTLGQLGFVRKAPTAMQGAHVFHYLRHIVPGKVTILIAELTDDLVPDDLHIFWMRINDFLNVNLSDLV